MRFKFLRDTNLVYGMIELTPEIAAEFLSTQAKNRSASEHTWQRYSQTFKPGTAIYQPLIFDDTDRMMDGQHRCHAVIESGQSVLVTVIANVPASAWNDIDAGKTRTIPDILSADGEVNCTLLASTIGWLHHYEVGHYTGASAFLPRQRALAIFEQHKDDLRIAAHWSACRTQLGRILSPSLVAFCYMKTIKVADRLVDFWNKIETGAGSMTKTDPALVLRNRMLTQHGAASHIRREHRLAFTIKAINAELLGQPMVMVRWKEDEPMPKFANEQIKLWRAS